MSGTAAKLVASGMSATEADGKEAVFADLEGALPAPGRSLRWFVPGRIEVLGKHTDYAGGRSLLCATERGMCVVAKPRHDAVVRISDIRSRAALEFPFSPDLSLGSGWGNYVATVVRRVARNFPGALCGVDLAISSDLPAAAGLSSSSVLVVAIFTALAEINHLRERDDYRKTLSTPESLAEYLGCIENGQSYRNLTGDRGVGTFGGSEDHTAILCSRPGQLACYRFCPVTLEQRVPLPVDRIFVVANSGVRANKTGRARDLYNRASRVASAISEAWIKASGRDEASLGEAVRRGVDAPDQIREALRHFQGDVFSAQELQCRFDQFLLESEFLVPEAVASLAAGDMLAFGEIVGRSQSAAEQLLGNQVPETIALAAIARNVGACAASAFGAGFGGSVWALVGRSEADHFLNAWRAEYSAKFPHAAAESEFFITGAGPGLIQV